MTVSKKFIVQSNWKMHKTHDEAVGWIETVCRQSSDISAAVELIACVPFIHLRAAAASAAGYEKISIGAQNAHWAETGAYTGETSARMIADAGGRYCVVGHSERRNYFGEDDEVVNRKTRVLLKHGISPIVCIGESIEQREKGLTQNQLERQVVTCFEGLSSEEMQRTVVLYEPIWAIGTGNNATAAQAQAAHRFIRKMIAGKFSEDVTRATRIMYGGSVKVHNTEELIEGKDVDGVGVGSGSLAAEDFLKIVRICSRAKPA